MNIQSNNLHKILHKRKFLRNNSTPQEIMVWAKLKNSQLEYKFRRQHSIGSYILDFYCPKKKLAVEIDGSQHFENKAEKYDEKRTEYLKDTGIRVLRFTNAEINTNMSAVLMKIQRELNAPPLTPP